MSRQQREAVDAILRSAPRPEIPPTVEEQRSGFAAAIARPAPEDVAVRATTLGGRPALELTPAVISELTAEQTAELTPEQTPGPKPVNPSDRRRLLYFHGGGYVIGSPDTHASLVGELARRSGLRTVSVDYRLAPEHPFPAAVEDGIAAYRELLASGIEARDVVIAGDSAGAGLTLATLLSAREAGLPQPAAAVLFSPWSDLTLSGASIHGKHGTDPIFIESDLQAFVEFYLGAGDRSQPLASPVFADLTGLPPLLIQVGANELLLDDAVRLAGRAGADNVDVTLEIGSDLPHVYQHHHGRLDEADAALDRAARFFTAHLNALG